MPVFSVNIISYSTDSSVKPVKKYANADLDKLQIIKENKGKSGVYLLINLINGKTYIGSSVDLGRRFRYYYDVNTLDKALRKSNYLIYRALLKYGYSNFSLEILEYCEKSETTEKEQFFMDKLNPEYNLCESANSPLGRT